MNIYNTAIYPKDQKLKGVWFPGPQIAADTKEQAQSHADQLRIRVLPIPILSCPSRKPSKS